MHDLVEMLDEMAGKATERPWEQDYNVIFSGKLMVASLRDGLNYGSDGAFIVSLVNAWPALRDRLRAAEKVCEAAANIPERPSPAHRLFTPGWGELKQAYDEWRKAKDGPPDEEKRRTHDRP